MEIDSRDLEIVEALRRAGASERRFDEGWRQGIKHRSDPSAQVLEQMVAAKIESLGNTRRTGEKIGWAN